jgi:hypothetical protein
MGEVVVFSALLAPIAIAILMAKIIRRAKLSQTQLKMNTP